MTFNVSASRLEFRPAWLFLLLSPFLSLAVETYTGNERQSWLIASVNLGFSTAFIGILAALGWAPRWGTKRNLHRFAKEFQPLLPGALFAVVLPGLLNLNGGFEIALVPYCLGCAILGATILGVEYEEKTLSVWLVQPQTRTKLYGEKLFVLGLLLGFAAIQFLVGLWTRADNVDFSYILTGVVVAPVLAWTTGPLLTLLSRTILAATVFTLIGPAALAAMGILALSAWLRWQHPSEPLPTELPGYPVFLWVAGVLYVTGAAWGGWWYFRRLEVVESATGAGHSALQGIAAPLERGLARVLPNNATTALIRKELRLHVVPWFLAGINFGFWLIWRLIDHYAGKSESLPDEMDLMTVALAGILGATTMVITGCECVADERLLGTLDGQLVLPVSVRRQWFWKIAVALLTALLLGLFWPSSLLWLGTSDWQHFGSVWPIAITAWPLVLGGASLMIALSILASSLSKSSIKAVIGVHGFIVLCGATWVVVVAFWAGILDQTLLTGLPDSFLVDFWKPTPEQKTTTLSWSGSMMLGYLRFSPLLLLAFCSIWALFLAGRNFRSGSAGPQRCWRSVLSLLGGVALLTQVVVGPLVLYEWLNQKANPAPTEPTWRPTGPANK